MEYADDPLAVGRPDAGRPRENLGHEIASARSRPTPTLIVLGHAHHRIGGSDPVLRWIQHQPYRVPPDQFARDCHSGVTTRLLRSWRSDTNLWQPARPFLLSAAADG